MSEQEHLLAAQVAAQNNAAAQFTAHKEAAAEAEQDQEILNVPEPENVPVRKTGGEGCLCT